ncbi:MAG: SH3 domain-containing protein [Candidatus Ozemobacteraceae bacterium]
MKYRHIGFSFIFLFFLTGLALGVSMPSKGKVTADIGLNLREGPGTNFAVLTTMPLGSVIDITSTTGSWYQVNYGSYTGKYCYSTYVEVTETRDLGQEDAAKYPHATLASTDPQRPAVSNIDRTTLP